MSSCFRMIDAHPGIEPSLDKAAARSCSTKGAAIGQAGTRGPIASGDSGQAGDGPDTILAHVGGGDQWDFGPRGRGERGR